MEKSIKEKLMKAFNLAYTIGEKSNNDELELDSEELDLVWGYADGLTHKWWDKMVNGLCSIQASIDFDMEKEEKRLDKHISMMEDML